MLDYILSSISENEYLIVAGLWFLGEIIKMTNTIRSNWIPFILLGVSMFMTPAILGGYSADNINMALIVAGLSVFVDQLFKQSTNLISDYQEDDNYEN